tara:strand:+ start:334 stop:666 length:333 start_codon:yes stop_codon:yes gene_type:complete
MMSPTDRAIMELDKRMREGGNSPGAPGIPMSSPGIGSPGGGFDASDLMERPEIKQEETRNQANMVSAPYREANEMAFSKNNPMNAESQSPGKPLSNLFLMQFVDRLKSKR